MPNKLKLSLEFNSVFLEYGYLEYYMPYLRDLFKQMVYLRYLQLDLKDNNLGEDEESLEILGQAFKNLPNLCNLELDLYNN